MTGGSGGTMTSLERVLTALGHHEPDRVPFFLLVTMHGARELGMSIREYFSRGKHVAEGQVAMRRRYGHDCYYSFFYAPIEVEAWGAEVLYSENGPPNSGAPLITSSDEITGLKPPLVEEAECLQKVIEATRLLKREAGDRVPIIGVVMSPFSLPVMQMGFEGYLDLIYDERERFDELMRKNEEFTVNWANAQLAAGATAICYFDPVSSTTTIPRDLYLSTGYEVARRTIAAINGPTATHMASGRSLPIIGDIAQTGTQIVCTSAEEDLATVKGACGESLAVLGNLNGIEMRRWTVEEAEAQVKEAIMKGGPGGGFILGDNHGEIPWQVPESVLTAISEAVEKWGVYPLDWAGA